MREKIKRRRVEGMDVFSAAVLTAMVLLILFPFYISVVVSFTSSTSYIRQPVQLFPQSFTLENYSYVIERMNIGVGYRNTLFIVLVGTALSMFISLTYAYALAMKDYPGKRLAFIFLLITMYFGGGMIPNYLLMNNLNLLNTVWVMIIPGAISVYNMIVARTYIVNSIPSELYESASLDGCTDDRYLWSIVLPLSKPIIAVLVLWYAVGHWNAYFNSLLYIDNVNMKVVQQVLREVMQQAQQAETDELMDWGSNGAPPSKAVRMASTVVATVPILCVYPFIQKFFTQGVMVGAVKG